MSKARAQSDSVPPLDQFEGSKFQQDTTMPDSELVEPEPETCPLCPSTGPPQPPRSDDNKGATSVLKTAEEEDENGEADTMAMTWIACTKCSSWFHSACLLLSEDQVKESIPAAIVEEVGTNRVDEGGPWFDWTAWVSKWYCRTCLDRASSPSNPRPPRHPLVATLKKGCPPFGKESKVKRSASTISVAQSPAKAPKRPRASASSTRKRSSVSPEPVPNGHAPSPSFNGAGSTSEVKSEGRPKRNVRQLDYHNLNNSIATPTSQWLDLIADPAAYGTTILDADYRCVPGKLLSKAWLESDPSSSEWSEPYPPTLFYGEDREPIIVRPEDGGFTSMGGHLPGKDLTVQEVAKLVGPEKMVPVIDVASQNSSQWSLQKWADYLSSTSNGTVSSNGRSNKVYNIISLEISDTELARRVKPPKLVREIDWVDNYWNFSATGGRDVKGKGKGKQRDREQTVDGVEDDAVNGNNGTPVVNGVDEVQDAKEKTKAVYPKVQLYCLMGMKGAWTDWHVDFAASSVYYTIHTGSKVFYFIRPTPENLKAYAEWSGSYEKQQDTWLGSMVDEVRKVVLKAGDTMIIPAGYIHAVYTPMNSIVFGGNFIHSYSIDTQLRLRQIEIDTKVPQLFRFPMFEKLCWYVADRHATLLRQLCAYRPRANGNNTLQAPHRHVLRNLIYLADFLISQIAILHNPEKEDKSKKLVYDRIPHEIVRDPEGLARELKWRVRRELGEDIDAMDSSTGKSERTVEKTLVIGRGGNDERELKRQRGKMAKILDQKPISRKWKFETSEWNTTTYPPRIETNNRPIPRPSSSSTSSHITTTAKIGPSSDIHAPGTEENAATQQETAEVRTSFVKQLRHRVREVDDGSIVLEEQETTFTERRSIWGPKPEPESEPKRRPKPESQSQDTNMDMDIDIVRDTETDDKVVHSSSMASEVEVNTRTHIKPEPQPQPRPQTQTQT
ncbi:hypothetical protein IAT40_002357 [Kwoniella sp. CBS 6097]